MPVFIRPESRLRPAAFFRAKHEASHPRQPEKGREQEWHNVQSHKTRNRPRARHPPVKAVVTMDRSPKRKNGSHQVLVGFGGVERSSGGITTFIILFLIA
jgi:hypothetical protein